MTTRKRTPPDPRHGPFRARLATYWQAERNAAVPDLPWGAAEAGALAAFLRANPRISAAEFLCLLQHRLDSDDHARGESPRFWLGALTRYANGPLDRFRLLKRTRTSLEATLGMAPAETCKADDRETALDYWRIVQAHSPRKFDREAPQWARQELARTQPPSGGRDAEL